MGQWHNLYTKHKNPHMETKWDIQNHCVCGLCPSSRILNDQETEHFKNWICFHLQIRGGTHLLCWVPQKEVTSITGLSPPPPSPEYRNRFSFWNVVFSNYSEFWAKSIHPVILSVIHHRQNPLDSNKIIYYSKSVNIPLMPVEVPIQVGRRN
jgi:hypothetical protein